MFLVEGGRRVGDQTRKQVAIGPTDVFEVDLKTAAAVLFAFPEERGDEGSSCNGSRKQLVQFELSHPSNDRHNRNVALGGDCHHVGVGASPDQPVAIGGVPGGGQGVVDFVRVLGK